MMDLLKKQQKIPIEKVVTTSFLVDISDVAINVFVAVISGSVVMFSQALEGGADLLASGLLLLGVRLSKRPASRKYPFGHGREVYFWTFISGLVTFGLTATLSFFFGLQRFLNPEPVKNIQLAYLALLIAIFTNGYSLSLSFRRLLGKTGMTKIIEVFRHSALIETKTVLVLDLMGTSASIFGLVALLIYGLSGDLRFDGIGAMAIGLCLAFFAFFILRGAKELLVGQSAAPEIEEKIRKAALSYVQVQKVLDLRTILFGPCRLLVNIEVHLKDELTTDEIEVLIDKIEKKIKTQVPQATHIQIELETPKV
jgi:cation diffusion facilitator family transporter